MRFILWRPAVLLVLLVTLGAGELSRDSAPALAGEQMGGPVFVSGDDAEDHCEEAECGGLYAAALNSLVDLSRSPGNGIVAIGMTDEDNAQALASWNSPGNGGPGVAITTVAGSAIDSVNFANFDVIFVPSNEADDTEPLPGITNADLARLNNRQADIVHFVNNLGGGLVALTEQDADPDLAFRFLPIQLEFLNGDYIDAEPTPALADLAPNADSTNMDHENWHNVWTGPPGFAGLQVLAVTPEVLINGDPAAAILGGAQVVLRGQLDLAPDSATNTVGTEHTLTVTILDPLDDSPVVGVEVDFEITEGPHAGQSGQATTDKNGMATFTYAGTLEGTDVIRACFVDSGDNEQCDVATKTWEVPLLATELTPESKRNAIFSEHTVTAAVTMPPSAPTPRYVGSGEPVVAIDVDFEVISGPNAGASGMGATDEDGEAAFTYTGGDGLGRDTIRACVVDKAKQEHCAEATSDWALQKGDDQCDKDIDPVDSLQNLRFLVAFEQFQTEPCPDIGSEFASIFGDMDCDKDADAVDALHILRHVAALPSTLPKGCDLVGSPLPEFAAAR